MSYQWEAFSSTYKVVPCTIKDMDILAPVCEGNPQYFAHMHAPFHKESLMEDLQAVPPGKSLAEKYFLRFMQKDSCVAFLDLIQDYPEPNDAYIGWFMCAQEYQHKGIGTAIIQELIAALKKQGVTRIALGYVQDNKQSEHFWQKQGFHAYGDVEQRDAYAIVRMQLLL